MQRKAVTVPRRLPKAAAHFRGSACFRPVRPVPPLNADGRQYTGRLSVS